MFGQLVDDLHAPTFVLLASAMWMGMGIVCLSMSYKAQACDLRIICKHQHQDTYTIGSLAVGQPRCVSLKVLAERFEHGSCFG